MAPADPTDLTGQQFAAPPPDAPQETTAPGSERPTADQVAAARANERPLPAFAPGAKPMTIEQQASFLGKTVDEIRQMRADAGIPAEPVENLQVVDATPPMPAHAASASPTPSADPLPLHGQLNDGRGTTGGPDDGYRGIPRSADHAPPAPPANLPVGTVLGADGKPMVSSTKPVDRPIVKKRPGLRVVHKPAPVAAEPPAASPVSLDEQIAEMNEVTAQELARGEAEAHAKLDAQPAAEPEPAPLPVVEPAQPHQPAASNSDSPARGVPMPIDDPGKKITGGFGHAGEAMYFPLDGSELRELIFALLGNIHDRLEDDLRFTQAITYPRCTARVIVEVEAFGMDETMRVEKRMPPHEKTPLEVARAFADEVVFTVVAERAEMSDDGQSIAPPDMTRGELGLQIPRKTAVQTPGGRMLVDVKQ